MIFRRIKVTQQHLDRCNQLAEIRQRQTRKRGAKNDKKNAKADNFEVHLKGMIGEMAMQLFFPNSVRAHPPEKDGAEKDGIDFWLNGVSVDAKGRRYRGGDWCGMVTPRNMKKQAQVFAFFNQLDDPFVIEFRGWFLRKDVATRHRGKEFGTYWIPWTELYEFDVVAERLPVDWNRIDRLGVDKNRGE
jgi:hypothetical protein